MAFPVELKGTKDRPDIDLDNLDDLLSQLTADEIDELNGDFDPDNSLLPPSQRVKDQTKKTSTGKFNRKMLLDFLEKRAKEEKDWEQNKPYVKELKGKIWKPKEEVKQKFNDDEKVDTEWDDILTQASEEELVDLAAVLGFHGMLNQTQYYASWENEKIEGGGFDGVAKPQQLKVIPLEPPNTTDVDASLVQIKNNDSSLKTLNLNNIKISVERLIEICEALKSNTHLETLEMASVAATDSVAKKLAEALRENKTLKNLNIESNFISGESLVEIMKAINENQTLVEIRVTNQKPEILGNKAEMQITKLIEQNNKLLRFGVAFEFPDARIRVHEKLQENNDSSSDPYSKTERTLLLYIFSLYEKRELVKLVPRQHPVF